MGVAPHWAWSNKELSAHMATICRVFSIWRLSTSSPAVSTRYSRTHLCLLLTDPVSPATGYFYRATRRTATLPATNLDLTLKDKKRFKVKADSSSVGAGGVPPQTNERQSSGQYVHKPVTGNKKHNKYKKPKLSVDQLKAAIQKRKSEANENKLKTETKENKRVKKETEKQTVRPEAPPTAPPTGTDRGSAESAKPLPKQLGKSRQASGPTIHPKDLAKALLELKSEKETKETNNVELKQTPPPPPKKKKKKVKMTDSTFLDHTKWRLHLSNYHRQEQELLVTQLEEKLDPSLFKSRVSYPSIIGTSIDDIDRRIKDLTEVGFSEAEVARIVPSFPFIVDMDWKRFLKVCRVLDEYGIDWGPCLGQKYINNLIIGTRYIEVLERNLSTLKKIGLDSSKMAEMLFENPILLTSPLSDEVYHTLSKAAGFGFNVKWISSILIKALTSRPVKVAALSSNTPKVMTILSNLGVSSEFMMTAYPPFFLIDDKHLYSIIRTLSTAPLFLDTPHIAYIMRSCPQDVAAVTDLKALQQTLTDFKDLLCPVANMSHILTCFQKIPSIINPRHSINDTVELFNKFGFSFEETRGIISKSTTTLIQDKRSLQLRVELFLSLKNSKPSNLTHVLAHSLMNFSKSDEFFTSRFNYTQRHDPSLLSVDKATQIFSFSDESFAGLFGSTASSFIREAMEANWMSHEYGLQRLKLLKIGK